MSFTKEEHEPALIDSLEFFSPFSSIGKQMRAHGSEEDNGIVITVL